MVRRIASQVHQQVSRLMRADYIKQEPAWYQAVLNHPPLPLPPKAPPSRTEYDLLPKKPTTGKMRPLATKPLPIYYIEDDIRRQFFRDHPFEAFRPTTLVEGAAIKDEHPIRGEKWARLRQRGRNPTAEDAIRFAVNLYQHHSLSLTDSYARAVSQFRALRSEHYIATKYAVMEARYLGGTFVASEIQHGFNKEVRNLDSWERREELDEGAIAARKRWKAIVERQDGANQWSRGQEYVRLWKEGIKPSYAPSLTEPIAQHSQITPTPTRS
ncbi:Mitochondrial ribosomal protein S25 domain containing protein [Amanita muscaria]